MFAEKMFSDSANARSTVQRSLCPERLGRFEKKLEELRGAVNISLRYLGKPACKREKLSNQRLVLISRNYIFTETDTSLWSRHFVIDIFQQDPRSSLTVCYIVKA